MSLELEKIHLNDYRKLKPGKTVKLNQTVIRDEKPISYTVWITKGTDKTGQIKISYHNNYDKEYRRYIESIFLLISGQIVRTIHRKTEPLGDGERFWDYTISSDIVNGQQHGLETKIWTLKYGNELEYDQTDFSQSTWDHGVLSGPYYHIDWSGYQTFGQYFNDKKEGIWTYLNANGTIGHQEYYINDRWVDRETYLKSLRKELDKEDITFPNVIRDIVTDYL